MIANEFVSDVVIFRSYAQFLKEKNRRENYQEITERLRAMHAKKYAQQIKKSPWFARMFNESMTLIAAKKNGPSMRSMQFAGTAIERNNIRMYNCSYSAQKDLKSMRDFFYVLLCGSGAGASIQAHHVAQLPKLRMKPHAETIKYIIDDSIEGWADAFMLLLYSFGTKSKYRLEFDYSRIREKGALISSSGAYAPGPEPLKRAFEKVQAYRDDLLVKGQNHFLPIDIFNILCLMADCVVAGGIRRAACIFLFSHDDIAMLTAKTQPEWWLTHPHYGRANISAVILRDDRNAAKQFQEVMTRLQCGGGGEPGIFWTNDLEFGTNPCAEIGLRHQQFCNLSTVNVSDIRDFPEFNRRAECAAFIGTLQAGYTKFPYIQKGWKQQTEEEALLGVSITGIGDNPLFYTESPALAACLKLAAKKAVSVNKKAAALIGINPAARVTCIKPEGTSSLMMGAVSSGIGSQFSAAPYIKNMRFSDTDPLVAYVREKAPELVTEDKGAQNTLIIPLIIEPPKRALVDTEDKWGRRLSRIRFYYKNWILPATQTKDITHNVSATVYMPPDINWACPEIFNTRRQYQSIAFFPESDAVYDQPPLEKPTPERLASVRASLEKLNLNEIIETRDNTNLEAEAACAGDKCGL